MEYLAVISTLLEVTVLLASCTATVGQAGASRVHIDDSGGYSGVLVALDPHVQYDSSVLPNLEGYFTLASEALHEATDSKTLSPRYFRDVTILLPNTWPPLPQCRKATSENAADANFLVTEDSAQWGSAPHTVRMDNRCGTTDGVTMLPLSFVNSFAEASKYGPNIGMTLVHEWAHQRYGVYDEGAPETCVAFEGGYTFPRRCSNDIQGETKLSQDGRACSFTPYNDPLDSAKASVMYLPYLHQAKGFCDRDGADSTLANHNENITNEHNDRCNGRSVTEILRSHPDFSGAHASSITILPGAKTDVPRFQCVQQDSITKMVLTLDISRSMKSQGRLEQMQNDIETFLHNTPCSNMAVGMVEFSDYSEERTIHPMVQLNDPSNVESLISALPRQTKDRTCIACGVRQAITTLRSSGYDTTGAVIAIFTDGMENEDELSLTDIREEIISSGVVLYASVLQILDVNQHLLNMVFETGGTYCKLYDDQTTTYYDCLENILNHNAPLQPSASILIHSDTVEVYPGRFTAGAFALDSQISPNAVLQIQWVDALAQVCSGVSVDLERPDGSTIENIISDGRTETSVTFNLFGDDMDGIWAYRIRNHQRCSARVNVEGRLPRRDCSAPRPSQQLLTLTPYIKGYSINDRDIKNTIRLYAKMSKGTTPVVGVSVHAQITASNGDVTDLQLWDNGAGADLKSRDGIYSRYFVPDYSSMYADGSSITYSVKFVAKWTRDAALQLSSASYGSGATSLPQFEKSSTIVYGEVERFQRASVGHFFQTLNSNYIYPAEPAKITDLRLQGIRRKSKSIILSWTAMGESMDRGTADKYEIRVSDNVRQLRNTFTSSKNTLLEQSLAPAKDGDKEEISLSLKEYPNIKDDTVYYVGISVHSSKGRSEVSNVVMFILSSSPVASGQKDNDESFPLWIVGLILAIIILLLIIIVITVIIRKKSNHKDAPCQTDFIKTVPAKEKDVESALGSTKSSCYSTNTKVVKQTDTPDLVAQIACIKAQMRHVDGPETLRGLNRCHTPEISDSASDASSDKTTCSRKPMVGYPSRQPTHIPRVKLSNHIKIPRSSHIHQSNISSVLESPYFYNPDEPLQNLPYTNPLFGDAAIVPEVEFRNSAIRS